MAYPAYLREKARRLRREQRLTIDELAECLALSRTTVYLWVRDLPLERSGRQNRGQRLGNAAMQAKYRRLREEAYADGQRTFAALAEDPLFRDFVTLYIAEGYKRSRNVVSLCNSDPTTMRLANAWLGRLSDRPPLLPRPVPRGPGPRRAAGVLGRCPGHRSGGGALPAQVQRCPARAPTLAMPLRRAHRRR